MLELINVSKYYKNGSKKLTALDDVSLKFQKTGIVSILGESGSGKSTLLNLISTMDKPSEGKILVDNLDISKLNDAEVSSYKNNHTGFIFQDYNLIEHLNVIENVSLPLIISGVPKRKAEQIAEGYIAKVGLAKFTRRNPKELSGGQQQRVSIARALVSEPKILFCDEPTGALDTDISKKILDFIKELSKDILIVMVTHNEDLATEYSDRIIRLADGKVIKDSSNEEVIIDKNSKLEIRKVKFPFHSSLKFIMNNFKKRRKRIFATSVTTSIGLIGIFTVLFLVAGVKNLVDSSDDSDINYEIELLPLASYDHAEIQQDTYDQIANKYSGSLEVVKNYNFVTEYSGSEEDISTTLYSGVSNSKYFSEDNFVVGEYLSSKYDVLIFESQASDLLKVPIEDVPLVFNGNGSLEILYSFKTSIGTNFYEKLNVVGVIQSNQKSSNLGSGMGLITEEFASELVSKGIQIDNNINNQTIIFNGELSDEEKTSILSEIKDTYSIYTSEDSMDFDIGFVLNSFQNAIIGISMISVIVSVILIAIMVLTSVSERVKEIGILRSIGARRNNIRNMFLIESALIGLISALVALIFTLSFTLLINKLLGSLLTGVELFSYDVYYIVIILISSMVVTMISGVIPSIRASRINPIDALRKV